MGQEIRITDGRKYEGKILSVSRYDRREVDKSDDARK